MSLSLKPASLALLAAAEAALTALGLDVPGFVALLDAREVVQALADDEDDTDYSETGYGSPLFYTVVEVLEGQYEPQVAVVASHLEDAS